MKILVAEDEPMNIEVVRVMLQLEGHTVDVAIDGLQAVEMTRQLQPDLVLMDMHMPRMDGLEATRRIKQDPLSRSIPVIALTASAMPAEIQQALDAGCIGHIAKPIDVDELTPVIFKLLQEGGREAA